MIVKFLLGLRNNAHRVEVVQPNGTTRPVLGTAEPQEDERRARIGRHWGNEAASPRNRPPATIDEPLSQRTQTILSWRVGPELQRRLNGGPGPQAVKRNTEAQPESVPMKPPSLES